MARPLVIGYHLIWTAYGFWLPNDPRGSSSHFVHSEVIFELGDLHKGRKQVQPVPAVLREFQAAAKEKLKFPLLELNRAEIDVVSAAIGEVVAEQRFTCYACALMPDHIHILIRKHKWRAEEMIAMMQARTRDALVRAGLREPGHPVWGGPGWKVFLDSPADVRRTIRYIEQNPVKIRRAEQKWRFVSVYDNWPVHPGSNSRSPYARRLRGES